MIPGNRRRLILTYLQSLLYAQKDQFRLFLEVLDKQKNAIKQGAAETITAYIEREEQILAGILAFQKSAESWEALCRNDAQSAGEILEIKTALEALRQEASFRSKENQRLLAQRMAATASELQALKTSPLRKRNSVYTGHIDITI
ncbi:MAG: flagellar protein FlgN [Spirochaetaceae bacterium]|jgi:hypothetical protein|nr:flagellar protein FlgN [Spirochaetaceae bacterium]